MTNILYNLVLMNISGTMMYLLSLLLKRRKRCAVPHYVMLAAAVVIMLVPFRGIFEIRAFYNVELPRQAAGTAEFGTGYVTGVIHSGGINIAAVLICVWLIGAVISFARIIWGYRRTRQLLKHITSISYDERLLDACISMQSRLGIRRAVELRTSSSLNSPLLYGFFHARLVIPERDFTDGELEMIMAHELTHYRHRDLWIALAAAAAACVNWFNPVVYMLCRELDQACEQCCDASVLALLEPEDRKDYGRLIISVIEDGLKSRLVCTTSMAAPKDGIQQRLLNIVRFRKPSAAVRIAGAVLVSACAVSSLTVFGFEAAVDALPEEVKESVRDTIKEPVRLVWEVDMPDNTAAPEAAATPDVTAAPEAAATPDVTAAPEAAVTSDVTALPEALSDIEEAPGENASSSDVTTVPETAEEITLDSAPAPEDKGVDTYESENEVMWKEPKVLSMPSSSYIMRAKFDEGNAVITDMFKAERDLKLYISLQSEDILLAVYDADTNEAVYDEREKKLTNQGFFVPMKRGQTYYIVLYCDDPEEAQTLYVSAE